MLKRVSCAARCTMCGLSKADDGMEKRITRAHWVYGDVEHCIYGEGVTIDDELMKFGGTWPADRAHRRTRFKVSNMRGRSHNGGS